MPLSRLYAIVSTSPRRTVTLCPTACETSVSAAVAPPAFAAASTASATRSISAVGSGKRPPSAPARGRAARAARGAAGSRAGRWRSSTDSSGAFAANGTRPRALRSAIIAKGLSFGALRQLPPPRFPPERCPDPTNEPCAAHAPTGMRRSIPRRPTRRPTAAVEDPAQGGDARAAGPRRSADPARTEAPCRARDRSRLAGPAGRRDPRGALDHRVGRPQASSSSTSAS